MPTGFAGMDWKAWREWRREASGTGASLKDAARPVRRAVGTDLLVNLRACGRVDMPESHLEN